MGSHENDVCISSMDAVVDIVDVDAEGGGDYSLIKDVSGRTLHVPHVNQSLSSVSSAAKDIPLQLHTANEPVRSPHETSIERTDKSSTWTEGIKNWINESAWPGMGLFGESYLLFSIGTMKPLWKVLYPDCLETHEECSENLSSSLTYSVVVGVIFGMIVIGTIANKIGRRKGSLLTALLMSTSAVAMTFTSLLFTNDARKLFISMSCLLFLFGVGVGGEYPLSASSASEKSMGKGVQRELELPHRHNSHSTSPISISSSAAHHHLIVDEASQKTQTRTNAKHSGGASPTSLSTRNGGGGGGILRQSSVLGRGHGSTRDMGQTHDRGKKIQLVFSMQGMGIFVNALMQTILLVLTGQFGASLENNVEGNMQRQYDSNALLLIWRVVYVAGAGVLVYVFVSRYLYLEESQVWAEDQKKKNGRFRCLSQKEPISNINVTSTKQIAHGADGGVKVVAFDAAEGVHAPQVCMSLSSLSGASAEHHLRHGQKEVRLLDQDLTSTDCEDNPKSPAFLLVLKNYGVRLFGASTAWLLWDIAFYGNKLFQSAFLVALTGKNTSLLQLSGAATANAFVALLGYFAASQIIDNPKVGRLGLQQYGFVITGVLFLACGFLGDFVAPLWLVVLYFGSSFCGQCGPNCTTFLIPAEIFPTEVRTMCHGIAASAGKCGALIAAVLFNYIDDSTHLFLISGYASFAAGVITFVTIPETTTLDLNEIDTKWRMIADSRKEMYCGPANDPEHLSFYERNKMGLSF